MLTGTSRQHLALRSPPLPSGTKYLVTKRGQLRGVSGHRSIYCSALRGVPLGSPPSDPHLYGRLPEHLSFCLSLGRLLPPLSRQPLEGRTLKELSHFYLRV